jgi:Asp-tRNA(Asn)/Glu-tRNA(Gln) amidotransferase A subunit family amidase
MLSNAAWTKQFPELFPFDAAGKPVGDHLMTLIGLAGDPAKVPGKLTIRDFASASAPGEAKWGYSHYLRLRGDAKIKTLEDLANHADFYDAPNFPTKKTGLLNSAKAPAYETSVRLQRRFAVQQIILAAMAELDLDALVSPTGILPARKILGSNEPSANGLSNYGMFNFIGAQGFPNITVPAGFVTEVYDAVPDPDAPRPAAVTGGGDGEGGGGARAAVKLTGPFPAHLPGGVDFFARPFEEPVIIAIAAAYEQATRHRSPPPAFGPLP